MANKRKLKKMISCVCSDLFSECVARSLYDTDKKSDNASSVLASILLAHRSYINRVSHPEPGMPAKVYYKDLKDKFKLQVDEVTDHILNL